MSGRDSPSFQNLPLQGRSIHAATMKPDLLRHWLDTTNFECPTLERPLKRRRISYPSEEKATSEPPPLSLPPYPHSDDYRQASRPATYSGCKQTHNEEVHSYSCPDVHLHWPSRYRDSVQHPQKQKDLALCSRWTIDPIISRLRTSISDSCLIGCKGCETSVMVQADYMPQSLKPSLPGSVASIGGITKPPTSRTTATSSENSAGSKQTRIDATNTNYRSDVLAPNRVIFKSATTPLPLAVVAVVNKSVFEYGPSEMDNTTAAANRDKFIQLGEDAEAELSNGFMAMDILPPKAAEKDLKRVQQIPLKNAILPRAIIPDGLSVAIQTICEPNPDVAYGYTLQAFTPSQQITQRSTVNGADLSKYSRLAKDLYWPFFIVEFKAPAVGGNIFVAENQCAGGGSACLLASQTLYTLASQANDPADLKDFVTYSAAIDGAAANLQVHWYEAGDGTYCLERIYHYDLNRPEDIQKFQLHTKNIVNWGVSSRLNKIRAALDMILAEEIKKKQLRVKRPGEPLSQRVS